jgi:hypothetical protein
MKLLATNAELFAKLTIDPLISTTHGIPLRTVFNLCAIH